MEPRKLSECLGIAFQYHASFGGNDYAMCDAAEQACREAKLTVDEAYRVKGFCSELVNELNEKSKHFSAYLVITLYHTVKFKECEKWLDNFYIRELFPPVKNLIAQIYEACYDKLVSEGK